MLLDEKPLNEFGLEASAFLDFGSLSGIDIVSDNIVDSGSLRASAGISLNWNSPFGPFQLDFGHAFLKEDYDQTEFFQFNIRNSF